MSESESGNISSIYFCHSIRAVPSVEIPLSSRPGVRGFEDERLAINDTRVSFALGNGLRTRQLHRAGSRSCLIKVVLDLPARNKVVIGLDGGRLLPYSRRPAVIFVTL